MGIIAQPDIQSDIDIRRLGEPRSILGHHRRLHGFDGRQLHGDEEKRGTDDDLTPGGKNNRRPDRACVVYANLIRQYFKNTKPLVLGGVEASLRRIAHYDYWSDSIRRSILFDARADILAYGMAEKAIVEIARRLAAGQRYKNIRGTCTIESEPPPGYLELPSYEKVVADKKAFTNMFKIFIPTMIRSQHTAFISSTATAIWCIIRRNLI